MGDRTRLGALGRRLARAFVVVSFVSLAVLFVGSVLPHLLADPPHPDDAVSPVWLVAATTVAALTAVLLSLVLAKRLTEPIDGYIESARRFAAGDHSARPPALGPPELADLTQALVAAADEVERSERGRRQLTADIAHELRNPLTALQIGLEELRDGLVPADRETLAALHLQAARLGRIVNDLSELAAAETSGIQVSLEDVDLGRIADLALAARAGSLAVAGLQVERDLAPGIHVVADPDRLNQVVGNLLSNAILYCRPGDQVAVRVVSDRGQGVLEVIDSGPGIPAHELPHLFDRGWRGSTGDGTTGSGLGLPIARALVLAQGGTFDVLSDAEQGVRSTVRLQLTVVAP